MGNAGLERACRSVSCGGPRDVATKSSAVDGIPDLENEFVGGQSPRRRYDADATATDETKTVDSGGDSSDELDGKKERQRVLLLEQQSSSVGAGQGQLDEEYARAKQKDVYTGSTDEDGDDEEDEQEEEEEEEELEARQALLAADALGVDVEAELGVSEGEDDVGPPPEDSLAAAGVASPRIADDEEDEDDEVKVEESSDDEPELSSSSDDEYESSDDEDGDGSASRAYDDDDDDLLLDDDLLEAELDAAVREELARQEALSLLPDDELTPDQLRDRRRSKADDALLALEYQYRSDLQALMRVYYRPIQRQLESDCYLGVSAEDAEALFANIEAIAEMHELIFEDILDDDDLSSAAVYGGFATKFRLYGAYSANFGRSADTLRRLQTVEAFSGFLQLQKLASDSQMGLSELLKRPLETMLRYGELLGEVADLCEPDSEEQQRVRAATAILEDLTAPVSEALAAVAEAETESDAPPVKFQPPPQPQHLRRTPVASLKYEVVLPVAEEPEFESEDEELAEFRKKALEALQHETPAKPKDLDLVLVTDVWLVWMAKPELTIDGDVELDQLGLQVHASSPTSFVVTDGASTTVTVECVSESDCSEWVQLIQDCITKAL